MLPDVLQAGVLAPFEPLVRACTTTLMLPIALGLAAYVWMCFSARYR